MFRNHKDPFFQRWNTEFSITSFSWAGPEPTYFIHTFLSLVFFSHVWRNATGPHFRFNRSILTFGAWDKYHDADRRLDIEISSVGGHRVLHYRLISRVDLIFIRIVLALCCIADDGQGCFRRGVPIDFPSQISPLLSECKKILYFSVQLASKRSYFVKVVLVIVKPIPAQRKQT